MTRIPVPEVTPLPVPEVTPLPDPPEGYRMVLAQPSNVLVALHRGRPTLYLDETAMEWRELDRHVTRVNLPEGIVE